VYDLNDIFVSLPNKRTCFKKHDLQMGKLDMNVGIKSLDVRRSCRANRL